MKTYLLLLVGIVLGVMIAFYIFSMLFTTPTAEMFPLALLPFGLAATGSFTLDWLGPDRWKVLAASVALPALLMDVLMFVGLRIEGRSGWGWVLVAGVTLCVCIVQAGSHTCEGQSCLPRHSRAARPSI